MKEKLISKIKEFFKKWYKRKRFWTILVIVFLILFSILKPKVDGSVIVDEAKIQNLESTVLATGEITSNTDLDLSFNASGVVRTLKVSVGDKVKQGDILASLDSGLAYGALLSAQGALAQAKAKYQQVLDGSSNEKVRVAEVALENAKRELFSADLIALPEEEDQISTPPVITGVYNGTAEGEYRLSFASSSRSKIKYSGLENGTADVDELPKVLGTKGLFISFSTDGYMSSEEWTVPIPNKSGANYSTNLNAYNAALVDLNLARAKATTADFELARAQVLSAEGEVQSASSRYEDTVIRAPANGTITHVDIKLGELATAQAKAITLEDVDNLYIEANINESSITKLKLGQVATFTADSFGPDKVFTGSVFHVDPSSTTEDGIVNYKIKVSMMDPDNALKPGMNADIKILVSEKDNVLVVPGLSVTKHDGKTFVRVITDEKRKKYEEHEVTTGMEGDGNLIEIISGLSEGEKIAVLSKGI